MDTVRQFIVKSLTSGFTKIRLAVVELLRAYRQTDGVVLIDTQQGYERV